VPVDKMKILFDFSASPDKIDVFDACTVRYGHQYDVLELFKMYFVF